MPSSDTNTHSITPFRKLWYGGHPNPHTAEYWTILPYKKKVYVFIERIGFLEEKRPVESAAAFMDRAAVLRHLRQLRKERQLNTVSVVLPDDYEDHAGFSLLQDVLKLGQERDFAVHSMIVTKSTEDLVAMFSPQTATI